MATDHGRIRQRLGKALRQLRHRGHLTLDEVATSSGQLAVRISRSHLSRVEQGQSDIALSRFLSLMLVLGHPASQVAEELAPIVTTEFQNGPSRCRRPAKLLKKGPEHATQAFRRAGFGRERRLEPEALTCWGLAESALGRWQIAGRLFARCLPARGAVTPAARLTIACIGQDLPGLARVLVSAIEREQLMAGALLRGACLLASGGDPTAAARVLSSLGTKGAPAALRALASGLAAEAFRRARQPKAALAAAETACHEASSPIVRADLLRIHARALGALRRPQAGLRLLSKARALARKNQQTDLLIGVHLEAERLSIRAGQRGEARAFRRAARALLSRTGADRKAPRELPLHGLLAAFGEGTEPQTPC